MVDVIDVPLVGGHPALDLVDTLERGVPIADVPPHDFLTDPQALLIWSVRVGLVDAATAETVSRSWATAPGAAAHALRCVREIREALHVVLMGSMGSLSYDAETVFSAKEIIHDQWISSAGRSSLELTPDVGSAARITFGHQPKHLLQDRVAESVVDALETLPRDRIRRCPTESGGCGWLFVDHTRNGSRRWCRMADCGTRVKTDRLTERRRSQRRTGESAN